MPAPLTLSVRRRLEKAAREAAQASYSPYSKFQVGAAVLTDTGKIYTGTNVENASYGLANCAERTAIFTAVAQGERRIRCVAVFTPTPTPTMPCGACRQVINEFGSHATVISVCNSAQRTETSLDQLLPAAFGPKDLVKAPTRSSSRKAR